MNNIKIFKFGSCRTNLNKNKNADFIMNFSFTHTTKQVIQFIKIYNNEINIKNSKYCNYIFDNMDIFINKKEYYKKKLFESDIVIIEISSIYEFFDSDNFYYNKDRFESLEIRNKLINNNIIKVFKHDENSIIEDLKIISQLLQKKIIFIGPINLKFLGISELSKYDYYIPERQIIDNSLQKSNVDYILIKNIIQNNNWNDICDTKTKLDTNHFSDLGYKLLSDAIYKKIFTQ